MRSAQNDKKRARIVFIPVHSLSLSSAHIWCVMIMNIIKANLFYLKIKVRVRLLELYEISILGNKFDVGGGTAEANVMHRLDMT